MKKKAKFKVGQVVCIKRETPFDDEFGKIVKKRYVLGIYRNSWHYRLEGWTERFDGRKESEFRSLTKKECG